MQWVFSRQSNTEIRRDPSESELFKNNQDDNEEYAGVDTLVRETIQNSIDAASAREETVRVRISLHRANEMPSIGRLAEYFGRLEAPLKTKDVACTLQGVPKLDCGFLVCEDFGTRGLEGDPKLTKTPSVNSNERQDFFWFWRNIARSGKTGDDLGRWGLGKTVYRAASNIGCMLGLTIRESDGRKIVMGQAVLKIHEFEGEEWKSDGFWCQGTDVDSIPLPVESSAEVEQFRQEWKLTRTDEPGLSIVVPYVVNLTGESIFQAVAINFFDLILRRKLVVEINAPQFGFVQLTDETIDKECRKIEWKGTKAQKRHAPPPIAFARNCLAIREKAIYSKLWGKGKNISEEKLTFDPKDMETLQAEFKKGKLVAARIPVFLPKKDGEECEDSFYVFLQKEDQKSPDSYYIREGMTITKINSTRARNNQTRGMVYVVKGPLASLLGDTEGPAHEDWLKSAERPDKTWKRGWKGRVEFVKKIIDEFYGLVSPPIEKADYDLLSEYFSLDRRDIPQSSNTASDVENTLNADDSTEKPDDDPPSFPVIEAVPKWFDLEKRLGGFRVFHSKSLLEIPAETTLEIQVAYDVIKGNPLQKWHRFDFDLKEELQKGNQSRIKFAERASKVNILGGDGKTIILEDISPGFSLTVIGFDIHRDLYVKVVEKSRENEEQAQ